MSWQAGPHPDDVARPPSPLVAGPEADAGPTRFVWRPQQIVLRPRADTPQVGTLILLPVLVPALVLAAVLFAGGWTLGTVGAIAVAVGLAQFVVAHRDAHHLRERGFVDTAPALLAALSPILYFAVRAARCEGHDPDARGPIRWAVGSTAIALLAIVVATWFHAAIGDGLAALAELG